MPSCPKKVLLSLSIAIAASVVSPPAEAYYLGYSPYGYGSFWLWPLSSALYSVTSPFYSFARAMTYPRLWTGTSGYYHPINYGYRQPIIPPNYMGTQIYEDPEPLSNPRERVRSYRPSVYPTDQVAHANWNRDSARNSTQAQDQALLNGALRTDPAHAPPVVKSPEPVYPSPLPLTQAPPAPQSAGLLTHAPLANGFVDRVNHQFQGDIKEALFDPETRSWARGIGLVSSDDVFDADLNPDRIALIKHLLQDNSVDGAHKIEAIRALLKR